MFFTPFNKAAMRFAYPGYDDEIRFVRDAIGFEGAASEFNVLDALWNAASPRISRSRGRRNITQGSASCAGWTPGRCQNLRAAGFDPPRIAVAGLNTHAGDGGNFGRDEIESDLAGGSRASQGQGLHGRGPFPSDTVFLRAHKERRFSTRS